MARAVSSSNTFLSLLQSGHLRSVGLPTVLAAVVLLASGVLLLGVNVTQLLDSFAWVQEADEELMQIADIDKHLVSNELTVRGYALTDDPAFVVYHRNETQQTKAATDKLAALMTDDPPEMKAQLAQMRALVQQRLEFFSRLIALGPGHAQEVADAIRDPKSRAVMRAARNSVETLRNLELKELAELQAASARQVKRTYGLAIGIVVLAFLFASVGIVFAVAGLRR